MMSMFLIAYLAGVLTIASPCIFPILPFVLARADLPFRRGGLPLLLGLAITFAVAASLVSVAGSWSFEATNQGRTVALVIITLFGLAMLWPRLAVAMSRPAVALGAGVAARAGDRKSATSSLLLGVATGLVWAPCAGPVLGLILTGGALRGPSVETSLLLFSYSLGAATALAAGVLLSGRVLAVLKRGVRWGERIRQVIGAAVVAGCATIWLGLDTGLLTRWSTASVSTLEEALLSALPEEQALMIPTAQAAPALTVPAPLASLLAQRQWLNTAPLQPGDLAGKVVLVNFWTYSCINCLRVLPYVKAWQEKYHGRGLVVIGVHTPEFAFEKDAGNVRKALQALGIAYPVTADNDFGLWRAFGNQSWPALYFFGADGRLRHRVIGEGRYEQSERLIQQMLSDARASPVSPPIEPVIGLGAQAAPDARNLGSGETYIGYSQGSGFASPGGVQRDTIAVYQMASSLGVNRWSLSGAWTIGADFATLNAPGGRIAYRFHARDLHLVLTSTAPGEGVRFRVTLDGLAPGEDHGADADAEGWGNIQDGRLYQLIRQSGPVTDRVFEIEFQSPGVRAYAFTFG